MKKVLVFGTFDGLHSGHINFLKQAKRYGDYLTVVIARDTTVKKIKGCQPLKNEKERLKKIKKSALADKAVLGSKRNPYAVVKKLRPDIILLGYDQKAFVDDLPEELKKIGLKAKIYRAKAYQAKKFHSRIVNKRKCRPRKTF